ncbi:hypothetical protein EJ08DRAFT_658443 [Tothia fuscella]|uniref:Uncharacterized protein n=1 Tax=Tothia fuscella TaxID=1048955 RepID=A0A9P4NY12_9PEZI|nr:hypothetical protein EJ08DRAFT_658443 [Tothia fuscella]
MQFSILVLSVASLLATTAVNAFPVADPASATLTKELAKRDGPGVYYCNDPNFTTDCFWLDVSTNSNGWCVSLLGTPWYKLISSFGPDPGVTCSLFSGDNCEGSHLDELVYPGLAETYSNQWDNQAGSFKCHVNK